MQGNTGKFPDTAPLPERDLHRRERDRRRQDERAGCHREVSKCREDGAKQPCGRPGLGAREQKQTKDAEKEEEIKLDLKAGQRVVPTERHCMEEQRKSEQKDQAVELEDATESDEQNPDRRDMNHRPDHHLQDRIPCSVENEQRERSCARKQQTMLVMECDQMVEGQSVREVGEVDAHRLGPLVPERRRTAEPPDEQNLESENGKQASADCRKPAA